MRRARDDAIGGYALVCLTSPNGVRLLFDARRAATRARWPARRWPRSGPAPRAELAATGCAPTWCRSARSPRRWSRRWRDVPVEGRRVLVARAAEARDVLPDALRERGAEVRRAGALRHRRGAARRRSSSSALERADYVTFTSSSTVRFFLDARGGRGAASARGWSRSARSPARRAREHGLEVHVEAERHDIDGLVDALAASDAAGDRHPAHRLRPRRRLRGRLPRRDPRRSRPRRRSWTSPTASRATTCASGALVLRNTLPYMPVGRARGGGGPAGGHRAARARAAHAATGALLVGPDNGLLALAWERCGGVDLAVDVTRSPHRLEPVSATFHGRDVFAPVAAHLAAGAELRGRRRRRSTRRRS